jgi:uncharacterized membrane protein YraQ (UPF0718 family)
VSFGVVLLAGIYAVLAGLALLRRDGTFGKAVQRSVEQFWILVPRMICALIAAGFIAALIPSEMIARYLGHGSGVGGILVAFGAGMIIPAGPVVAFPIAAVFARGGASTPALITFIASWSIFAAHRIIIYEIPLLGPTFLRLRLLAAGSMPLIGGVIGVGVVALLSGVGQVM